MMFSVLLFMLQAIRFHWSSIDATSWGYLIKYLGLYNYRSESRQWLLDVLAQIHCHVSTFNAESASGVVWGMARLTVDMPLPSERWVSDFANQLRSSFVEATSSQLAAGLWGVVQLGFKPSSGWLTDWEQAAAERGWQFDVADAEEVAVAYRMLGRLPPFEISSVLAGAGLVIGDMMAAAAGGSYAGEEGASSVEGISASNDLRSAVASAAMVASTSENGYYISSRDDQHPLNVNGVMDKDSQQQQQEQQQQRQQQRQRQERQASNASLNAGEGVNGVQSQHRKSQPRRRGGPYKSSRWRAKGGQGTGDDVLAATQQQEQLVVAAAGAALALS